MAHPKHKISKARRDKRRTHKKVARPTLVRCPQCQELKPPHRVCLHCGTYKGREILKVKEV